MSFAAEMKDFFSAFKAMKDTRSESEYRKAVADYYRGGKGKGSLYGYGDEPKKSGGLFGGLFGGGDDKDPYEGLTDIEAASKRLTDATNRALRAGDVGAVKKLQDDARYLRDSYGLGKKSGGKAAPAVPAPETDPSEGKNPSDGMPRRKPLGGIYDDVRNESEEENKVALLEDDPFGVSEMDMPDQPKLDTVVRANTGGAIPEDPGMGFEEEEDDTDPEEVVTTRMSDLAAPGVDAGLRYMSRQAQGPQQAIPEAGMSAENGVEAVARNVGAATPQEIAMFNKIIDPEGKLPDRARSAARIAAVWDMYGDKDPDKAERMINSLMLYDKKNSQTRGAMAMQAYQDGDMESATRLIADAYNEDLPSSSMIQPAVLGDGQIGAKIIKGGKVVDEKAISEQEFGGLIQKVASGSAYLDSLLENASRADAARGARGATETDKGIFNEMVLAKRALSRATATDNGTPESRKNIEAMQRRVDEIEQRGIEYAMKQRNPAAVLKQLGISAVPGSVDQPRGTTSRSGGAVPSSVKEREVAAEDAKDARLRKFAANADSLEQAALPVTPEGNVVEGGRMLVPDDKPGSRTRTVTQPGYSATGSGVRSEGAAVEAARRTINPQRQAIEDEIANRSYQRAEKVKGYGDDAYAERTSQVASAYDTFLANTSPDKTPRQVEPQERRTVIEMADRIAQKNDVDPYRIIQFIDNATRDLTQPVKIDRNTGDVVYGGQRMKVDSQTLALIAKMRGEAVQRATAERNQKFRDETEKGYLAPSGWIEGYADRRKRLGLPDPNARPMPNYDFLGNPTP